MAFVLIEPGSDQKGIIVFKHLELPILKMMDMSLVRRLREEYLIGLYIGFSFTIKKDPEFVDFYIAADNVLTVMAGEKIPRLSLNGFNFIDAFIKCSPSDKMYDFLFVGNSLSRKNLLPFVKGIGVVLDVESSASFCIINRCSWNVESFLYVRRVRFHLGKLPKRMRSRVLYIELPPTSDPLPAFLMSHLLGSSRSLVITSRSEGAARVVAEAALNNMPVLYYSKMKGGTGNHLDPEYDVSFSDLSNLGREMLNALEKIRAFKNERSGSEVYLESNSKQLLKDFLQHHFKFQREFLDQAIDTKKLYNAFSGHQNLLHERFSSKIADEILCPSKMYMYISHLCGAEVGAQKLLYFKVRHKVGRLIGYPLLLMKSILKGAFM